MSGIHKKSAFVNINLCQLMLCPVLPNTRQNFRRACSENIITCTHPKRNTVLLNNIRFYKQFVSVELPDNKQFSHNVSTIISEKLFVLRFRFFTALISLPVHNFHRTSKEKQ